MVDFHTFLTKTISALCAAISSHRTVTRTPTAPRAARASAGYRLYIYIARQRFRLALSPFPARFFATHTHTHTSTSDAPCPEQAAAPQTSRRTTLENYSRSPFLSAAHHRLSEGGQTSRKRSADAPSSQRAYN